MKATAYADSVNWRRRLLDCGAVTLSRKYCFDTFAQEEDELLALKLESLANYERFG